MGLFGPSIKEVEEKAQLEAAAQFIRQMGENNKHTPDLATLCKYSTQSVFIYDEWMRCHTPFEQRNKLGKFEFVAFTKDNYELWRTNREIPHTTFAVSPRHKETRHLPIKGEVWSMPWDSIVWLDNLNRNGLMFNRVRVELILKTRIVKLFLKNRMEVHRSIAEEPLLLSTLNVQNMPCLSEQKTRVISAWMYVANEEYWKDKLDGGFSTTLCQTFGKNNVARYYYFSQLEINDLK